MKLTYFNENLKKSCLADHNFNIYMTLERICHSRMWEMSRNKKKKKWHQLNQMRIVGITFHMSYRSSSSQFWNREIVALYDDMPLLFANLHLIPDGDKKEFNKKEIPSSFENCFFTENFPLAQLFWTELK